MSLVNIETGEIVEPLDRTEAERLTTRIRLRLDTIADNYVAVMPLIREAIERQAWQVLGYSGVSEYVSECFGDALSQLSTGVRREVVSELAASGMSTRAIAPVVGVHFDTVARDIKATSGVVHTTPDPEPTFVSATDALAELEDDVDMDVEADVIASAELMEDAAPEVECERPAPIVGLDGKKYQRPTERSRRLPRPAAERTLAAIQTQAAKAAREAQSLTPEQIRRVRAEADHVVASLRNSIEVLQHLVNSLDNKESK